MPTSSVSSVVHAGLRVVAAVFVAVGFLLVLVPLVFPTTVSASDSDAEGEPLPDRVHAGAAERFYAPESQARGDVWGAAAAAVPPQVPSGVLPALPEPVVDVEPATDQPWVAQSEASSAAGGAGVAPSAGAAAVQDASASAVWAAAMASSRAAVAAWCPASAPEGTLRDGASAVGVKQLCEDAVRDARTVEAAKAVVFAFSKLGTPYSMDLRNSEGFFDCSSLVYRAYLSAGVTKFFSGRPYTGSWADESSWAGTLAKVPDSRAGDIRIMWQPGSTMASSAGAAGHAQLYLTDGWIIQSGGGGDSRVNVARDDTWGWQYQNFAHVPVPAAMTDPDLPALFSGE